MAKTKEQKEQELKAQVENTTVENEEATNEVTNVNGETEVEEVKEAPKNGPTYEELLSIVQTLSQEVQSLKANGAQATQSNGISELGDILGVLANRKSDREVTIVHNCELLGGLTTHIKLSTTTIDFSRVGETRLLSWQQFEECAAKYRDFFDRKIILVDAAYADVAKRYNLPCTDGAKHILTQEDINALPTMEVPELEKFIESLDKEEQLTVFNYWLGKCYSREEGFYDRYKMDTLNRLSQGMFENILLVMNGDSRSSLTE